MYIHGGVYNCEFPSMFHFLDVFALVFPQRITTKTKTLEHVDHKKMNSRLPDHPVLETSPPKFPMEPLKIYEHLDGWNALRLAHTKGCSK
jgi:hypothetical protein